MDKFLKHVPREQCDIQNVVCSCDRCGNTWMQTTEYFKMKNITKAVYDNCEKCHKIGEEFIYIPYCE